jgi:uncharacterized coiled-coil DUF342 family protein
LNRGLEDKKQRSVLGNTCKCVKFKPHQWIKTKCVDCGHKADQHEGYHSNPTVLIPANLPDLSSPQSIQPYIQNAPDYANAGNKNIVNAAQQSTINPLSPSFASHYVPIASPTGSSSFSSTNSSIPPAASPLSLGPINEPSTLGDNSPQIKIYANSISAGNSNNNGNNNANSAALAASPVNPALSSVSPRPAMPSHLAPKRASQITGHTTPSNNSNNNSSGNFPIINPANHVLSPTYNNASAVAASPTSWKPPVNRVGSMGSSGQITGSVSPTPAAPTAAAALAVAVPSPKIVWVDQSGAHEGYNRGRSNSNTPPFSSPQANTGNASAMSRLQVTVDTIQVELDQERAKNRRILAESLSLGEMERRLASATEPLKKQLESYHTDFAEKAAEALKLQVQLSELEEEKYHLSQEISKLRADKQENSNNVVLEQYNLLSAEYNAMRGEYEQHLASETQLRSELSNILIQLAAEKQQNDAQNADIQQKIEQISRLQAGYDQITYELSRKAAEIAQLQAESKEKLEKIEQHSANVSELEEKLSLKSTEVVELQGKIDSLSAELQFHSNNSATNANNAEFLGQLEQLSAEFNKFKLINSELQQNYERISSKLAQREQELTRTEKEADKLHNSVQKMAENQQKLAEELQFSKENAENLKFRNEELQKKLQSIELSQKHAQIAAETAVKAPIAPSDTIRRPNPSLPRLDSEAFTPLQPSVPPKPASFIGNSLKFTNSGSNQSAANSPSLSPRQVIENTPQTMLRPLELSQNERSRANSSAAENNADSSEPPSPSLSAQNADHFAQQQHRRQPSPSLISVNQANPNVLALLDDEENKFDTCAGPKQSRPAAGSILQAQILANQAQNNVAQPQPQQQPANSHNNNNRGPTIATNNSSPSNTNANKANNANNAGKTNPSGPINPNNNGNPPTVPSKAPASPRAGQLQAPSSPRPTSISPSFTARQDEIKQNLADFPKLDTVVILQRWQNNFSLSDCHLEHLAKEVEEILEGFDDEEMRKSLRELEKHIENAEFLLVEKVGTGGFGSVYRGQRRKDNLSVAIKIIDLEESTDDIQTISREIAALATSQACPQLTNYYGSSVQGTQLWIVMEYIDGGSVLDRLKYIALEEKYIAVIVREVLLGLQYLENERKIHRDIKAANILMSRRGDVKLGDFGASRQLTDTMTKCNTFVGSPYWMAPEVMMQSEYDGKADICQDNCIISTTAREKMLHNSETNCFWDFFFVCVFWLWCRELGYYMLRNGYREASL